MQLAETEAELSRMRDTARYRPGYNPLPPPPEPASFDTIQFLQQYGSTGYANDGPNGADASWNDHSGGSSADGASFVVPDQGVSGSSMRTAPDRNRKVESSRKRDFAPPVTEQSWSFFGIRPGATPTHRVIPQKARNSLPASVKGKEVSREGSSMHQDWYPDAGES